MILKKTDQQHLSIFNYLQIHLSDLSKLSKQDNNDGLECNWIKLNTIQSVGQEEFLLARLDSTDKESLR